MLYGHPEEHEDSAMARLICLAFGSTPESAADWLRTHPRTQLRAVREGAASPHGCLVRIPMGQVFGGKVVPMVGIAGVAVAPEARGRGTAREMMTRLVRECHADGTALSTLYASTQSLYRQVGYEQAGVRQLFRLPTSAAKPEAGDASVTLEALNSHAAPTPNAEDLSALRECYAKCAAASDGFLDRGMYIWNRIFKNRDEVFHGYACRDGPGGPVEGYLFMVQRRLPEFRFDVHLSDFCFRTARAGRRLLAFLSDFGMMARDVTFAGGAWHPALALLPQQKYAVDAREFWMLRVTHVRRALLERGYPAVSAAVCLEVRDETIPENNGPWTLRIEGGEASCEPGHAAGVPRLRLTVNALAGLYTGFIGAAMLPVIGWGEGDAAALRAAAAIFAGPTPWTPDFF